MEVKKGYKQTEVGMIPEDWEVKKLGEVGSFSKGKGIRKDEIVSEGLPCIRYGEIYTTHNDYIKSFKSFITQSVANESIEIRKDDLLFAGSGETAEEIGKCVAFVGNERVFAGGDIVILRPSINNNSLFLGFLLNNPLVSRQKARMGQGDAVVHISGKNLSEVQIPLPPTKAEQTAIATALSDADALISRLENLIAKKRNIKQGAMQELLIGKKRLPGFSGEWEVKRIGEYLKFQVGYPFSSIYFNQKNEGIRLVKNRDLKSDDQVFYFNGDYPNEYLVSDGDVLIGMDGDFLPCLWKKGKAVLNQRVGRLVVKRDFDLRFAYYLLAKPLKEIENSTSSTTVKHLSHKDVEKIEIAIPSKAEQTRIATILSDMDAEIEQLEQKLDKFKMIKQGMMQELLTGKTRLI